jgi:PAT family beta-lactamase induction signal transducer AmpG
MKSPIRWVPSLYFTQGLPFYTVALIAGLMMKSQGVPNDQIGRWTGLLGLAWVFKPLWSPLLERAPDKKPLVVAFQYLGAISLGAVALALQTPLWMALALFALAFVALASATHDIAADGLYINSLSAKQQAMYAGWQGAFFNAGRLAATGGLLVLAGHLERQMAPGAAWSLIFGLIAVLMALLATWHLWALPSAPRSGPAPEALGPLLRDVLVSFFRKPGIWWAIAFIVLFRAGEGQIQTIGPLFLREARSSGGLGLSTDQVGIVYGTAGTVAFIVGSILGGYFTAWLNLKRALPLLIVAMNAPNLVFWWLSTALPTDLTLISAALALEMFGYGFGFVGVILFIMQVVAPGPYQTAHYALGTGVMQLGFVLFKTISGDVQTALGYQGFFGLVLLAALPVLLLSLFVVPRLAAQAGAATPAASA